MDSRNFWDLRRQKFFVDKTLWLRDFWNDGVEQLYLTAPSRFGKTTLLNMMVEFFDKNKKHGSDHDPERRDNRGIFEGTNIVEQDSEFFNTHFRKHVILFLNFRSLEKVTNLASTQRILCEIYSKARHNLDPKENWKSTDEKTTSIAKYAAECKVNYTGFLVHLPSDVKNLYSNCKCNDSQLIVLVDDVDHVISSLIKLDANEDTINSIMTIVGGFLNRLLGNYKFIGIRKCLLVGSMYLPGTLTLSSLDNEVWRNFNSDEKYAKCLGLTHQEVEELLAKFNEPPDRISDLEDLYGGYIVRNSTSRVFNTGSVVAYLASRKLDCYWLSHIDPLQNDFSKVISRPSIGSIVEHLVIEGRVHAPPQDSEGEIYFKTLKKMRDSPSLLDEKSEKVAENSFLRYLENVGYLSRSYAVNTLHAANKETAFGLGQVLVQNSNYYEYTYNLSGDTKNEYVDAFMALTVQDPEYSMFKLAMKIQKMYASIGYSTNAPDETLNFGGLLYAWLRYSGHKNITTIIGEEVVCSKDIPKSLKGIWSRDRVFWGTPLTYGMPMLAVVRNDMVGILANFKRGNSSAFALKQLYDKQYHEQFPRKLGTYDLQGKIYMGINIDEKFNVTICYFTSSHVAIDFVEYSPS